MHFIKFFIIVITLSFLQSCSQTSLYQSKHYVFGTIVDISIYGESDEKAEEATQAVLKEFTRLHHSLHAWKKSDLTDLNESIAKNKPYRNASAELIEIIKEVKRLEDASHHLFNPAIGEIIDYWGFHQDEFNPIHPDPSKINILVKRYPSLDQIRILGSTISSTNPHVKIDLGGYAKGYALDRASKILRDHHIKNALINIGGNIIAIGQNGDRPWRVGIQDPRGSQAIAKLDLPDGWAIGTSGDYQRYFMIDGVRYCHLIDPFTGFPVQGVYSVTVLIEPAQNAGALSDVLSKPLFIAKREDRRAIAEKLNIRHYLIIEDNVISVTQTMADIIQFLDVHTQKKNRLEITH
ncbi:MAG: FAD:protein FMN transferase [Betaproteobacteria bacterium]|nr:FAD:protein FMN transferase [Betaproteobacteria bacterium]